MRAPSHESSQHACQQTPALSHFTPLQLNNGTSGGASTPETTFEPHMTLTFGVYFTQRTAERLLRAQRAFVRPIRAQGAGNRRYAGIEVSVREDARTPDFFSPG